MTLEQYRQVYKIPAVSEVSHMYINSSSKRDKLIEVSLIANELSEVFNLKNVLFTHIVINLEFRSYGLVISCTINNKDSNTYLGVYFLVNL